MKNKRFYIMAIVIYLVPVSFMFLTMIHPDIEITYSHALQLLTLLKNGEMDQFYLQSSNNPWGCPAYYNFPIYILFALWNLPIKILVHFTSLQEYSIISLLWCKAINIVFLILCCYKIRNIMKKAGRNERNIMMAQILFISSSSILLTTFVMSQYDIITLFFILWGIEVYISNKKITCYFLFIFALANTFKMLGIFLLLPLLLLREKNILKVAGMFIVGISGNILFSLYPGCASVSSIFTSQMLERIFDSQISGGMMNISIFMLIYILFCIYIYSIDPKENDIYRYVMWIGTATYGAFTVFADIHPQWSVLLIPFIILSTLEISTVHNINFLAEGLVNIGLAITECITYYYVFMQGSIFSSLLLPKVGLNPNPNNNLDILIKSTSYGSITYIFMAVFTAGVLVILYLSNPLKNKNKNCEIELTRYDWGIIIPRISFPYLYIVTLLFIAFF